MYQPAEKIAADMLAGRIKVPTAPDPLATENALLRAALEAALPHLCAMPAAPLRSIYEAADQVRAALGIKP